MKSIIKEQLNVDNDFKNLNWRIAKRLMPREAASQFDDFILNYYDSYEFKFSYDQISNEKKKFFQAYNDNTNQLYYWNNENEKWELFKK